MPQALAKFIDKAIVIADKRNLAEENPIVVTIPVVGQEDIITVVSILEPNNVTLPFNVTWIVADQADPDYGKALRRVSALPFSGRRNTWAVLSVFQDILDEPQFYDRSAAFSLGEVQTSGVQPATVGSRGTFTLNIAAADENDPVVVGDNDPRMSDSRVPTPHSHPLMPYGAIAGSSGINEFFVTIANSQPPVAGQTLMISNPGSAPNEWIGNWKTVTLADIEYDGASFDTLTINGPTGPVDELSSVAFTADASFSDNTTQTSVPAHWSIIANGQVATISSTTGVLTTSDVDGDQIVRVQASYTHPASGVQQIQTFDVTITDTTVARVLDYIQINGPTSVNENTQNSYSVTAVYTDTTTQGITPTSFTSSNNGAGTFDNSTGVLTTGELLSNQLTTLSASYTENGITKSTTLDITAVDLTVYPDSAVINGPVTVSENTSETYFMTVTFTDSSESVVAISNWASSNPAAGSIDSVTGEFTAPVNLDSDEVTTISASYTNAGRTVAATLEITATDETVYPVSAVITGPATLEEGGNTATYQLSVTMSDTTVAVVSVSDWASDNTAAATINSSTGLLTTANDIGSDTPVTLSASYTSNGATVNATRVITVEDTTNYPVSGVIVGNGTMDEGTSQTVIMRITYLDTTTADVAITNWASSNTAAATIDATTGEITANANVIGNKATQISGSYTENGVTITPTALTLSVLDITVYPVSAAIEGFTTVNENTSVTYQLRVTFDDSTTAIMQATDWSIDNASAGTINSSTGVLTAPTDVTSDQSANVTASFTRDGTTVSASLSIVVTDETIYPALATILGATNVQEGNTETYTLQITYTDSSTSIQTVSNWTSSNPSVATINTNTGVLSALDQVGNQATTISASYTSNGVTVSDSHVVTVVDTTIYPVSAVITGANSVTEGASSTYQLSVTYSDTSVVVESASDWASSNTAAATINSGNGVLQAVGNVIGDQTTTISASFTAEGTTVTADKSVTISDVTVYPVSAVILGDATVDESSVVTYQLQVTYDDTSVSVVPVSDWAIDNPDAGTINATTGAFTAASNSTKADINAQLSASYTLDGTTVNATLDISVADTTLYPVSAAVVGAATINEDSANETYLFEVTWSNSSTTTETISDWASSNTVAGTIVANTGVFTPATDVSSNETTNISGSFTAQGETVNGTLAVTVVDTTNYPVSAIVMGSSSVNEGGTATYQLQVTFADTSVSTVTVSDWASDNTAAAVIDAVTGVLVADSDIVGNQTVNISASYTDHGVTVTGTQSITINDTIKRPASAVITGPATVDEGSTGNYVFHVTYDDNSESDVVINSWSSDNTAGSINANTGLFTAVSNVSSNTASTLTGSYTENGATVNASLNITIVDTTVYPSTATILGSTSMTEGDAVTYQLQVTYTDSSTSIVSVSDWAVDNAAAGTIVSNTGVFTSNPDVSGNQSANITASYTSEGTTVNATLPITVTDVTKYPSSVAITGPATVDEGVATSYTAVVTYTDTSTADVTVSPNGTWSVDANGSIGANTGEFTGSDVTSDQLSVITFSYTEVGTTVTDTHNVTVTYVSVPTGAEITGPTTATAGDTSFSLTGTVTFDDSSTSDESTNGTWSSSNPSAGSINPATGEFTPVAS